MTGKHLTENQMKWNRQGRMEEQPEKEISGYTTEI
jgi:hypothetical protein